MPDIDLNILLAAHKVLVAELDRRATNVEAQEARARLLMEDCAAQRHEIQRDRATLAAAELIYRRKFRPDDEAPPKFLFQGDGASIELRPKSRARIGPQRYRMFVFLRQTMTDQSAIAAIVAATGLNPPRVRKQMRLDAAEGFVAESDDRFQITATGLALLERFETYKRSKGEPLPSLEGPIGDEEEEGDVEPEPEERIAA